MNLPVKMLHDRILIDASGEQGERRSSAGIVIPATASMGKRLQWAKVVATGNSVRHVEIGNTVLFDPEDKAEVEIQGKVYTLLRERDVHALQIAENETQETGMYL